MERYINIIIKNWKKQIKQQYTDLSGNDYFELKNGKGKLQEYHDNGALKYEGEYLNGLRNGKGVEYYKDEGYEYFKKNNNSIC